MREKNDIFTHVIFTYEKITVAMVTKNIAPFRTKIYLIEMIWHFIGVYIINRTLRGRLGIGNFSSRVENISLAEKFGALTGEIFFNTRREISYFRAVM